MSSALQSVLTSLQQNNYASLAVLTAVGYDYVLTFSDEIEYIWRKPWTWVSTLFILVRYTSLYSIVIDSLGTSFLPGPVETCVFVLPTLSELPNVTDIYQTVVSTFIQISPCLFYSWMLSKGRIVDTINAWAFLLFLSAADFVMILRLWAMYNRSRLILGTLLPLFFLEIVSTLIAAAVYSDSRYLSVDAIQILDFSFCVWQPLSPILTEVVAILQMTHGTAMCILAIARFVKQSLQMYRVTKGWQLNQYMNLLVKHGILYFLFMFLFNVIEVLSASGNFPTGGWQAYLLYILTYVPMYTLTPRFILSIRELYARDVQGRRGEGIDTGFGLSSGRGAVEAEMVFADVEPNERLEDDVPGRRGDGIDTELGLSLSSRGAVGTAMVFVDIEQNEGLKDVKEVPRDIGVTWP